MAALTSTQSGDRPSYINFTEVLQKERSLLEEETAVAADLKWLEQTLSLLSLNSSNPATDPELLTAARLIKERKTRIGVIVSSK